MMLPVVIACVVGIVIAGYTVCALGAVGNFSDPHDWEEDGDGDA